MVLGMALVAAFATVLAVVAKREPALADHMTLLVLPFETLSAGTGDHYLGDGLTDEMITRLGRLDPLRLGVIARTSARAFAESGHDLTEARGLLRADFALEGSVRREGDRVRVSATLIQIGKQTQLWSDSFDRDVADVLDLQRDIAERVADALALELLPSGIPADARPVDPVAYDATLRGHHFWNQQTPDGFRRAGEAYRQALTADSAYAPAWAGLANTYALVGIYDFLPPRDVFPLARNAAMRALAIDSTSADAWASLGVIQTAFDWDWAAAEQSLRRAIELNASDAIAREWYAILLAVTGRTDQAFRESQRALAIDPLSLIVNADRGWLMFFARRYDDAAFQLVSTLQLDPHFYVAHDNLAWVYFVKGDYDGFIYHALKAAEYSGSSTADVAQMKARYDRDGWQAWRRTNVAGMVRDAQTRYVSPYDIALQYAAIGEPAAAMEWLERSFERREVDMIGLKADPRLDAVRDLPAFGALVKRVGFPAGGTPRP
jgi:TolB-like protein/Tfp pilus assembly protein PilF